MNETVTLKTFPDTPEGYEQAKNFRDGVDVGVRTLSSIPSHFGSLYWVQLPSGERLIHVDLAPVTE